MADQLAAEPAQKDAVVKSTHAKQTLSWTRYTFYLSPLELQTLISRTSLKTNGTKYWEHSVMQSFTNFSSLGHTR
jgi:hypothetical protein